ncbi:hypothetical protein C9374_001138 [Naegleria lovaniensis]|uniref:Uncharacterized protein n=1 Tax=Naegleria lovaniensis TaxID=51637 RepID=A0AA88GXN4_NAELO|nr:uncharacterized protein C9374_001138 [Naegleria lovaniensis]KAG2387544.1 hypothetical protein C9374_001138 [Naegleria lovaniensis]
MQQQQPTTEQHQASMKQPQQTTGWAIGHSVMTGLYGYAVADLMLLFVALFMFVLSLTGMIGLWSHIHPEHKSRLVRFNYMGCVWGLNFISFLYVFMWVTEFAFTGPLFYYNNSSMNGSLGWVVNILVLFHPGFAVPLSVFQCLMAGLSSITSTRYYVFTEEIRMQQMQQMMMSGAQVSVPTTTSTVVTTTYASGMEQQPVQEYKEVTFTPVQPTYHAENIVQ